MSPESERSKLEEDSLETKQAARTNSIPLVKFINCLERKLVERPVRRYLASSDQKGEGLIREGVYFL